MTCLPKRVSGVRQPTGDQSAGARRFPMTVSELRELLASCDPEAEVRIMSLCAKG